ncbi:MAG: hypothetical protein WBA81_17595 [Rhodococcus sp. (in: high G+C Gram-positive bacteria)]
MTQPRIRPADTHPAAMPSAEDAERGRPLWALFGLLVAVSIAVLIMTLGFSAA